MKVAVSTYSISRCAGGVFDAVRCLFLNKAFSDIDLSIFSFNDVYSDIDIFQWQNIPVYLFDGSWVLYSRKYKRALLEANADVIHFEALWRYPHILIKDLKSYGKKAIVCSPHGMLDPWIIKNQGRIKRIIAKVFFDKNFLYVDCFHALCFKELEDIRSYGVKKPIAVIPNGISIGPKKSFHLNEGTKRLLYLGRLHEKKGIDLLLEAIGRNKQFIMENNWVVDIVGWEDGVYVDKLMGIVDKYMLQDIVLFHGGVFGEEKRNIYYSSDAFILPSHGEGLPMTVLEAWACCLPVIMTPQCHIPEGFEANCAIQINDNVESVEDGLIRLISMDDKQRYDMGERGYELVNKSFTWDAVATKMRQLYDWLVSGGEKPDFVYL